MLIPEENEDEDHFSSFNSALSTKECAPEPSLGWRPDPSVPSTVGKNGEITPLEALELFGVEPGDDPNCFHSDSDFVLVKPSAGFKLLRTCREEFAKAFYWESVLSGFEWKLTAEYASSKTGAWQQPVYALEHVHSPETHVGIVLSLANPSLDRVIIGKIYKGTAADR
jgi:hypothetical protein